MDVSKYKQECIEELRKEIRLCEDCNSLYNKLAGCPLNCSLSTRYKYWSPNDKTHLDGTSVSRFKDLLIKVSLLNKNAEEKISMILNTYKESCAMC